ncbi:alpha-D-ribose 1-methylphosphonate 5-triphosphate diphosphatase [Marinobacter fonticola]|uniref:alpha-D-ribose 1-methylphosphonate 5-triphosphate diphosphatase n=1 Tax=Marinobacter fonticola TaxID=2603215 RepID=UPI0011E695B1|nr:alpha-D-ribose 1-methylphosphonate 5-triphosphate diphosphatase [Marinobacter fonticola]
MSHSLILTNVKVVTATEVFDGTVVVENGRILRIDQGVTSLAHAVDGGGDYLLPGLVELHTDNLEKHFAPRPGVRWPARSAVMTHDAQIVASGITTVFDALSLGDVMDDSNRLRYLQDMVDALDEAREAGVYRADHLLHLRCEVSYEGLPDLFGVMADHPMVHLVSVMDHSPGQRQFVREDKYRQYYQGKYGLSEQQMEDFILSQKANSEKFSSQYRRTVVDACRHRGIPLASHDDATQAHVAEACSDGMTIAEFPTTEAAAKASHEAGLKVLMGAPNVVRGGSHSGNVAASALAEIEVLDILSSDYYPSSLLDGAFRLSRENAAYTLPRAIDTVSRAPARSAGLTDRGEIAQGQRADLVLARADTLSPVIRQVWREGERVF